MNIEARLDQDVVFEIVEELAVQAARDPSLINEHKAWSRVAGLFEFNGWKRRTGMTQKSKIMAHLKKAGSITVREAMIEYSIQSLTKRIQELREDGHEIVSNVRHHPVSGQKYVRYSLDTEYQRV